MRYRTIIAALIASCFGAASNAGDNKKPGKRLSAPETARQTAAAAVSIDCLNQERKPVATTSGFLISESGRILTSLSPLTQCGSLNIRLANGDSYDSVFYVNADARKDFVLLRIKAASLPFFKLGDSSEPDIGQTIFTPHRGIVNGVRQMDGYKLLAIATGPALKPGTPVLDEHGMVIAVVAANIATALPINYTKGYLDSTTELPFAGFAAAFRKRQALSAAPAQAIPPAHRP